MGIKEISPDQVIIWQWGPISLNATILFTWGVIALLVLVSWLVTRRLSSGMRLSRWQNLLEVVVNAMRDQIRDISQQEPGMYLPFVGTLFLLSLPFPIFWPLFLATRRRQRLSPPRLHWPSAFSSRYRCMESSIGASRDT